MTFRENRNATIYEHPKATGFCRRSKYFLCLIPVFAMILLTCGCEAESMYRGVGPVRVGVVIGASSCNLASSGPVTIRNFSSRRGLYSGRLAGTVTIKYSQRGIIAGDKLYNVDGLLIEPGSDSFLIINGRGYRGTISIHRENNALTVVNYVGLEDYVKGVMTNEVSASWDQEALKAQAVAARTFAVYHMLQFPDRLYSIEATKIMYRGKDTEDVRTNNAVDRTRGEVLFFNDALLLPHFSASCGGHTEYSNNVWPSNLAFTQPVRCPYCATSNQYVWEKTLSKTFIAQKLRSAGIDVREVRAVTASKKSVFGGRLTELTIQDRTSSKTVTLNAFRLAVGSDVIRSGFMTIENGRDDITFRGKGWGHGVGLCQYGSKVMADMGYSYEAILSYYYQGAKLKRIKY